MNSPLTAAIQKTSLAATTLEDTKRTIDAFLSDLFAERITQADEISSDYGQLWRSIAQLSQAGGKRIRPYITLLTYNMNNPVFDNKSILPASAAQELLHLAMLIHDDIIDRDQVRYGVKNITGQYSDIYTPLVDDTDERLHFSDSAAILAGDLLIAEAYSLIQRCNVDASHIAKAQAVLSQAIFRVIGGELLDTESAFRSADHIDTLTIAREKTASYSFVSPLLMGGYLADMEPQTIQQLTTFGTTLGVAYQLQDDILGIFGDEQITGKSTSSDITEGKYTHLVEQFCQRASTEQVNEFNSIFKNPHASAANIERARELLTASGAVEAVRAEINELASQAVNQISQLSMNDETRTAFIELVRNCTEREK